MLAAAAYVQVMKTMKEDKREMKAEMKAEMTRMELKTDIKFFVTILVGFPMTWYRAK